MKTTDSTILGWIQDFLIGGGGGGGGGGDVTREKMGVSMFTFIGMINLTMQQINKNNE